MDTLHWILLALAVSLYSGSVLVLVDEGSRLWSAMVKPIAAVVVVFALPGILVTMGIRKHWIRGLQGPLVPTFEGIAERMYIDSALFIGRNRAITLIRFDRSPQEDPHEA